MQIFLKINLMKKLLKNEHKFQSLKLKNYYDFYKINSIFILNKIKYFNKKNYIKNKIK